MSALTRRDLAAAAVLLVLLVGVIAGCGSDGDDLDEFQIGPPAAVDAP